MTKKNYSKRDIYQEVTDQIIKQLEEGSAPWLKPWKDSAASTLMPMNVISKKSYSGVNVLLLWCAANEKGYESNAWLTYKQAQDLGGNVRKGEKGQAITFWKINKGTETNKAGEEAKKSWAILKRFTVFNVAQCENLGQLGLEIKEVPEEQRLTNAEHFIQNTGATINHGTNQPCYVPSQDVVFMPHRKQFEDGEGLEHYYSTALHELTHWTSHKDRCDRSLNGRFGSESYAAEELIAEMGAAFLCAQLGIKGEMRHTSYLKSWLKVLKEDKKAIFTAASMATKAADYLNQQQKEEQSKVA